MSWLVLFIGCMRAIACQCQKAPRDHSQLSPEKETGCQYGPLVTERTRERGAEQSLTQRSFKSLHSDSAILPASDAVSQWCCQPVMLATQIMGSLLWICFKKSLKTWMEKFQLGDAGGMVMRIQFSHAKSILTKRWQYMYTDAVCL